MIIWILLSAVLAASGPFGSYGMGMGELLPLWLGIIGVSLLIANAIVTIREIRFPEVPIFAAEMASSLAFTALFSPALFGILWLKAAGGPPALSFLGCCASVYFIATVISAIRLSVDTTVPEDAPAPRATPRLLSRLEDDPGPVLRVAGKDHFVEVVTPRGAHDIRMRLGDAVAEMDGVEGYFTHRSHWVARSAIQDVAREGGKHFVESADGERIPVSRAKLPELEQAGLI